jgi:hypothetical protein
MATTGCPLTSTRGFGAAGVACPAWAHMMVAPRWSKGPGMFLLSFNSFKQFKSFKTF